MYSIGIDIGGTFTDLVVLYAQGNFATVKVLTTPDDPSRGVRTGMERLLDRHALEPAAIEKIIHATTLVTNAIIERKGAKTALITTEGFRDTLEIGREKRFDLYDLSIELPVPLVPRHLRHEVRERLAFDGSDVVPLDEAQARECLEAITDDGVESIAVCFLHAFRNDSHERQMRALAEAAGAQFVSISSEVAPDIREFERTSTTVANAYVQPLVKRYLRRLRDDLAGLGYRNDLLVMLSNGGIAASAEAERFPIRLLESGPSAGAMAASFFGALTDNEPILSLDMGGTTAKLCLVENAQPLVAPELEAGRIYRFKKGSGLPIRVPAVEMIEIGTGGGSIAHLDSLGLLKVGPESAGADPGPACYDLGGTSPTVTDADLVLGYLDADYFLGGTMRLNGQKSREAIDALGAALQLDGVDAAHGIHRVCNASMANAAQVYAAEKGRDLRRYTMVAFGGASPAHACAVADLLGIAKIVVPIAAGVSSAFGLLVTRPSIDRVRAYMGLLADLDWRELDRIFAEMEDEGRALMRLMSIADEDITSARQAELRYSGQRHQITVPIQPGVIEKRDFARIEDAFSREYARLYGRTESRYPLEALNWKASISGPPTSVTLAASQPEQAESEAALKGKRPVHLGGTQGTVDCPIYDRYKMASGVCLSGPAIIEEDECTTIVAPGWQAEVDGHLNIILTATGRGQGTPETTPESTP